MNLAADDFALEHLDGRESSGRSDVGQPAAGAELHHREPEAAALSTPLPWWSPVQDLGEFFR